MEIVDIGRNFEALRDIGVVLVLRACDSIRLADSLSLFEGFVSPYSCVQVGSLLLKVVHGNIKELKRCASTEEYDFMGVGNIEKFLPKSAAFIHYFVPFFSAVGDGKY